MLLAIDAGNTEISFAVFQEEDLLARWNAATTYKQTADELGTWLFTVMDIHRLDPQKITGTIISCVVPDLLPTLQDLCRIYFNSQPMQIGEANISLDMAIQTERPEEVGADLLVDAVAGKKIFSPPFLILNMGTATTLSLVNHQGDFAGVAIAPGLNVALEALTEAAAALPKIFVERPKAVIGTSTVASMQAGIFWGYIGLVEGLIVRARKEYAQKHPEAYLPVIASGGLCALLSKDTELFDHCDPDLTLKGLKIIYHRNYE